MPATLLRAALFLLAPAQETEALISATPDSLPVTLEGEIEGRSMRSWTVDLEEGETLHVTLETTNTSFYFNIYPPGSEYEAAFIGSSMGKYAAITAQTGGRHRVMVYLVRSAARRGETARFELTLARDTEEALPPDFTLDGHGPDYLGLKGGTNGLRLRQRPSVSARTLTTLSSDAILENRGCGSMEGRRWCRVIDTETGRLGYAAGAFLVEGSSPALRDRTIGGTPFHTVGELRCGPSDGALDLSCRFGVTRRAPGSALVELESPGGETFQLRFTEGRPDKPKGAKSFAASGDGDITLVTVGAATYRIVDAIIEGG